MFYASYSISVGISNFVKNHVVVEKGVLQGDNLSPLIFNLCFNTLNKKIKLVGYNYTNPVSPCHWLQFADDTALATATQEDSKAFLNVFRKW